MQAVRAAAARHETTPAAWARRVLVTAAGRATPVPTVDPALLEEGVAIRRELVRIGTLLNQSTRRLNQGRQAPKLAAVVAQVRDLIEGQLAGWRRRR